MYSRQQMCRPVLARCTAFAGCTVLKEVKVFNGEYSLDVYSSLNFKSSGNKEPSLDVVLAECRVFVQCTVC